MRKCDINHLSWKLEFCDSSIKLLPRGSLKHTNTAAENYSPKYFTSSYRPMNANTCQKCFI